MPASLVEASRETKIRLDYLAAMERDSFEFVSGRVYVRGMLRGYARWLGLDEDDIAAEFERAFGPRPQPPLSESLNQPAVMALRGRRPHWAAAAAVAALVLLGLSLVGLMRPAGNVAQPPSAPASPTVAAPPPPATVAEAPSPKAEGVRLMVAVTGAKCWILVNADGNQVFQGTIFNGDSRTFEAKDSLTVTFGLLPAVRLELNGRELAVPQELGVVGKFVFTPETTALTKA